MKKANYNRIKAVLAEKNKTNVILANHLGVNKQTVSTWCRNIKQPSYNTLYEIAKFLNVEIGDLFTPIKDIKELES
jgi:putative transcriptional regulator